MIPHKRTKHEQRKVVHDALRSLNFLSNDSAWKNQWMVKKLIIDK
jgi:hypothetical protein